MADNNDMFADSVTDMSSDISEQTPADPAPDAAWTSDPADPAPNPSWPGSADSLSGEMNNISDPSAGVQPSGSMNTPPADAVNTQPAGFSNGYQGGQMNGQPNGYQGGQMNGQPNGYQGGQMNGQPNGYQGGQMNGQPNGYQGGQMNGQPNGYQGGQMNGYQNGPANGPVNTQATGFSGGQSSGPVPNAAGPQQPQNNMAAGAGSAAGPRNVVQPAPEKPKKKFSLKEWVPGPQVPNQLTIIRICMIPLFVVFILWVPKPLGNILATITFILASLTDAADGYIARRYNYVTTFGKFMDPLADKLLVCSALICLVDLGRIESWIVIIIVAREFIISGFRLVAAEKGIVIAANFWGKLKTICQMVMVILMVANFGGFLGMIAQALKWIALALTLISLATYMFKNRRVLQDKA